MAVHVLQSLDGERSFAAVVSSLASKFDAPADRISMDAGKFLADMLGRRMVAV
ncbi:MAG: PqqD family protein [Hyphomicrobiales bacterium]|nr:PqqD family protein [Hyphomicrobiales bacterium]